MSAYSIYTTIAERPSSGLVVNDTCYCHDTKKYYIVLDATTWGDSPVAPLIILPIDPTLFLRGDGTWAVPAGGSGDVVGPASSVDNRIAVFDGTTGKLIKDSGALLSSYATLASPTFTGTVVFPSGQALIAPVLGTPTSGTLTNCTFPTLNQNTTGSAAILTTARNINGVAFDGSTNITVTAAAGTLTGTVLNATVVTSSLTAVGTLTALTVSGTVSHTNASPFSMTNAQVVTVALTAQTSGAATLTIPDFAGVSDKFVFKTLAETLSNKTFVAPALGAATATSINGLTITTSTGTVTITNAKTLSVTNTLTFTGTDSTVMTFPTTSATIARTDAANTFTGVQTFSSAPVFSAGVPKTEIPNGITNNNSARQSQVVVSATNYYITSSNINLPNPLKAGMVVGTKFMWDVVMDKTAAGTGIFQISIYRGTNGSTSDTQDVLQTIGTQTAAVDSMIVRVTVVVTTTGASGAYFWSICPITEAITATGFGVVTGTTGQFSGTVSGVAMNTASLIFGLGFKATTGTPTISVPMVRAQAINIC